MTTQLGELTWPVLYQATRRPLLAVPVGSCEQHGPHLPLDTDTRIAVALANGLVQSFDPGEISVTPALTISSSGEHGGFPGTLSFGNEVVEAMIVELVRSADWSSGVVFVNGHGGNAEAMWRAVSRLTAESRPALAWFPRVPGGDAHAGHTETSMMLALAPELVVRDQVQVGRLEPINDLIADLRIGGMKAVSPNGVLGDPTGATAAHGRSVLTRLTIDLVAAVDEWWV